jgi:hypothetical protein
LHPAVIQANAFARLLYLGLVANEVQARDAGVRFQCVFDAFDDNLTTVVATHDIHYNSHKWKERGKYAANSTLS